VREQSATRQQLEASIRALLPSQADIDELTPSKNSAASIAGVGGIMTGYVWGATAAGRSAKGASLDAEAGLRFRRGDRSGPGVGEEISEMAFARRSTGALPILGLARRA